MSEDGISEGIISKAELAELADLFDKFEFAFDPRSISAREAESAFDDKVHSLFEERVAQTYPQLAFAVFYCRTKSLCREFLKRNRP
jgi:hypothetical protein